MITLHGTQTVTAQGSRELPTPEDQAIIKRNLERILRWCQDHHNQNPMAVVHRWCGDYLHP